jgi:alkylation response protein AidB-like acyl-CoA dehydrogenase
MELELTEEQALLHETTVRFIESETPIVRVRALHEHPDGFERSWWQKAAELGWFSLLVPEADGGGSVTGDGVADAALIAEELGRSVQPGPFVPANVVAAALSAAGAGEAKERWLGPIIAGEVVATWAPTAGDAGWDGGAGVTCVTDGDGFVLSGRRGFVQDLGAADVVLVAAVLDGGAVHVLVPTTAEGLDRAPLEGLDLSRRFAHLDLHGVRVPAEAVLHGEAASPDRLLGLAVALTCAETVGAMERLFTMTVEYSKDRIAFGRPIGSFQALKHIMADLALDLEACQAAAVTVCGAVGEGRDDADEVVSTAASAIADRSEHLAQMALQIHGGIGYTWEHDLHLFMRRIRTNAVLYGDATWHRERLCAIHGLGGAR